MDGLEITLRYRNKQIVLSNRHMITLPELINFENKEFDETALRSIIVKMYRDIKWEIIHAHCGD